MAIPTGERPVKIVAREGTHWGAITYMRSKRMPSDANLSRFGVLMSGLP